MRRLGRNRHDARTPFGPRSGSLGTVLWCGCFTIKFERALVERSELTTELERAQSENDGSEDAQAIAKAATQDTATIDYLTTALRDTAQERDKIIKDAQAALNQAEELRIEMRLMEERNELIFRQIEEAMNVSIGPWTRCSAPLVRILIVSCPPSVRVCGLWRPINIHVHARLAPTENERAQSPS